MNENTPKSKFYKIIKWVFVIIAALLIINSTVAVFYPLNLGSFLPGALGIVVMAFVFFIKPIVLFLHTKTGRVIGWICGAAIGVNIIFFIIFAVLTLTKGTLPADYKPDAVIVLGAGLNKDRVSKTLASRLDLAAVYCQNHPGLSVIVSGGQGPHETVPESEAMAKYLIARGIPADNIIQEPRSSDTEENFAFSKAILSGIFKNQTYKIVYITNQFHIYRAGLYAKKASLTAVGLAAPTTPRYLVPNCYSREYFALIKYWLFRR